MIVWGSRGAVVELGQAGEGQCAVCEKERPFRNVLTYRYAHIWYLFTWVTERQYLTVCNACNRGARHDTKAFEAQLGKSPIPLYRRYSFVALLALVAAVVVIGTLDASHQSRDDKAFLASPQVGDRYSVDLGKVVPGGFDGNAYGVVRISAIDNGNVTLQIPQTGYSQWRGADADLHVSKSALPTYYVAGANRVVTLDELKRWHPNVLHHVDR